MVISLKMLLFKLFNYSMILRVAINHLFI